MHEGPPNKALPAKFFADEVSCIFTSEMIQKYDQLNHEFAQRMRKTSWPRDLADLILLDIQFLKSCEVEWKSTSQPQPPAVSTVGPLSDVGPAAAADDDAPRRSPPPDAGVAARFEDAAFDFTKWDIYNDGSIPMDRFSLSRYTSLAFPLHFAAAGLLLLNTDCKTSQVFKDLKFAWERHTNMELEGSLRQLNAIMMIPSFAMWSIDSVTVIDEEKWVCNNRKAFAALQLYKCSGCRCGKQASSSSDGHCGH